MRERSFVVGLAFAAAALSSACGSTSSISAADGASLGENGDTNVMRLRLDASVPMTADCRAHDLVGKGSHVSGPAPIVTADDPSVLGVLPRGGNGWSLEGRALGETILEVSGDCEGRYPVRVVDAL